MKRAEVPDPLAAKSTKSRASDVPEERGAPDAPRVGQESVRAPLSLVWPPTAEDLDAIEVFEFGGRDGPALGDRAKRKAPPTASPTDGATLPLLAAPRVKASEPDGSGHASAWPPLDADHVLHVIEFGSEKKPEEETASAPAKSPTPTVPDGASARHPATGTVPTDVAAAALPAEPVPTSSAGVVLRSKGTTASVPAVAASVAGSALRPPTTAAPRRARPIVTASAGVAERPAVRRGFLWWALAAAASIVLLLLIGVPFVRTGPSRQSVPGTDAYPAESAPSSTAPTAAASAPNLSDSASSPVSDAPAGTDAPTDASGRVESAAVARRHHGPGREGPDCRRGSGRPTAAAVRAAGTCLERDHPRARFTVAARRRPRARRRAARCRAGQRRASDSCRGCAGAGADGVQCTRLGPATSRVITDGRDARGGRACSQPCARGFAAAGRRREHRGRARRARPAGRRARGALLVSRGLREPRRGRGAPRVAERQSGGARPRFLHAEVATARVRSL